MLNKDVKPKFQSNFWNYFHVQNFDYTECFEDENILRI